MRRTTTILNSKLEHDNFKNIVEFFKKNININKNLKQKPIIGINSLAKNKFFFFIKDLFRLAPHSRLIKFGKKNLIKYRQMVKCQNKMVFIFLEKKKNKKTSMWLSSLPSGPLVKISIESVTSFQNFYFLGNCKKWSVPILSFDETFTTKPHLNLVKKIFIELFSSKKNDIRIEPFFDHVVSFCFHNSTIWIRIYQLNVSKKINKKKILQLEHLIEIGPRIALNVSKIWSDLKKRNIIYDSTIFKKEKKK